MPVPVRKPVRQGLTGAPPALWPYNLVLLLGITILAIGDQYARLPAALVAVLVFTSLFYAWMIVNHLWQKK